MLEGGTKARDDSPVLPKSRPFVFADSAIHPRSTSFPWKPDEEATFTKACVMRICGRSWCRRRSCPGIVSGGSVRLRSGKQVR